MDSLVNAVGVVAIAVILIVATLIVLARRTKGKSSSGKPQMWSDFVAGHDRKDRRR